MARADADTEADVTASPGVSAPGHDPVVPRGAGSVVATQVVVTVLASFAAVAAIVERHWLEGRAVWIVVLAAGVVAGVWVHRRWSTAGAAVLAVAATWVAAGGLDRIDAGFSSRALDDDLPPRAVYAVVLASVLACLGSLGLTAATWLRRGGGSAGSASRPGAGLTGRGLWLPLGAGVVVAAVLVPSALVAGGLSRAAADRRADADAVEHTVTRRAERLSEERGPARPAEQVWEAALPGFPADDFADGLVTEAVAVPGWDVIVVFMHDDEPTSRLVALSKTSGDELWRYERHGGSVPLPTVDPESGRILLVRDDAAVVLSLEDGEELATRRLAGNLGCGANMGHAGPGIGFDEIAVGPTAVLGCYDVDDPYSDFDDVLAMIDVATARVVATTEPACVDTRAAIGAQPPTVLRSNCGLPTVLALDPDTRRIEQLAEIPPPAGASEECITCSITVATDQDLMVVNVSWDEAGSPNPDADCPSGVERCDEVTEIVALTPRGNVRWRTDAERFVQVVAVTERGIVTRDSEAWRLLSLDDGRELLVEREPGIDLAVADGERIYGVDNDGAGITVRSVDDLSLLGTWSDVHLPTTGPEDLFATGGHLIGLTPSTVVAIGG